MEGICEVLNEFGDICCDPPSARPICERCRRPVTVCWCPFLPAERLHTNTNVFILQHPFEETRPLQTAPILCQGLATGKCTIIKGQRFSKEKFPALRRVLAEPTTLLMFPGPSATDLDVFLSAEEAARASSDAPPPCYNLVMLDGTWSQAKGLYSKNMWLQHCTQVQLSHTGLSEYTIRTQPNDASLSTLETGAIALSMLEGRPEIHEALVTPLRALCNFQKQFGAVTHQSKQYLMDNGLYHQQHKNKQQGSKRHRPANHIPLHAPT